ncbi:unnamed protein product [Lactuca virosa]|uniref:Uncharacterized protein n=1 Tax=Lactuca virosa TaxID=75947 RepID=A0AAU9N682_9ASTR|nr:unnamed protein product [Lactuca virosa]
MMFLPYLNWLWATGLELDLVNFTIVLRIAMIFLLFSLPFALNPIASFNQHQKGSPHRFHTSNRSKIILLPHYYVFFRGQQNLGKLEFNWRIVMATIIGFLGSAAALSKLKNTNKASNQVEGIEEIYESFKHQ